MPPGATEDVQLWPSMHGRPILHVAFLKAEPQRAEMRDGICALWAETHRMFQGMRVEGTSGGQVIMGKRVEAVNSSGMFLEAVLRWH